MFEIGDEVMIDIGHVPNTNVPIERGTIGRVVAVRQVDRHGRAWIFDKLFYAVNYDKDTYWFAEEHLSPKGGYRMPAPLFDLDDMELAEILLEELREK